MRERGSENLNIYECEQCRRCERGNYFRREVAATVQCVVVYYADRLVPCLLLKLIFKVPFMLK